MKNSAPSSDDDESEEEVMEDEEVEIELPVPRLTQTDKCTYGKAGRTVLAAPPDIESLDEMDIDLEAVELSQPSQGVPILTEGPKRTYAKQRSYLDEANLEAELMFSLPLDTSPPPGNHRRGLNANPVSRPSDDEDDDQPTSGIRSIHELRKGGEILRFRTEIEALLDDIKDTTSFGKARRRSAMLELATKLSDATVVHRIIELGLDRQLISRLVIPGDLIFNFAAAATLAFVIKAGVAPGALEHIFNAGAVTCFAEQLERDTDISRIAKERKSNLSKVAQGDVSDFRIVLGDSSLWKGDKPERLSPQLVGLRGLDLLVRGLRKAGSKEDLLDDRIVSRLLDITEAQVPRLGTGPNQAVSIRSFLLCLSIAESLSLSGAKAGVWNTKSLRRVADLPLLHIESIVGTTKENPDIETNVMDQLQEAWTTTGAIAKIRRLGVRLVINLSNNNARACEAFSIPSLLRTLCFDIHRHFIAIIEGGLAEIPLERHLERLYLSLGALINLAEFSDATRTEVCHAHDAEAGNLLDLLVGHFLVGTERAAEVRFHSYPFLLPLFTFPVFRPTLTSI
jgi:hypothetical protein